MNRMPDFIVIDDEPINNIICRKIIQMANPDTVVHTFTNPEEGAAFVADLPPDAGPYILLLDINMPVTSGWEVLDALSDSLHQIPITTYLLSSSIAACDKDKAAEYLQVKGYITKPLTVEVVKELAASAMPLL